MDCFASLAMTVVALLENQISKLAVVPGRRSAAADGRPASVLPVGDEARGGAQHVAACDEAYRLGPPPPRESYLDGRKILAIAQRCGAQAIHPGYGFLSENEGFARACSEARIVEMDSAPMADAVRGLVAGLSVVFWAFATWLIPVLVAAGVWRHFVRKVPLVYVPTLWSMIFPLGMYAVAGIYLGRADQLPIVETIGSTWLWVAVTAWVIVFVAMVRSVSRALLTDRRSP